MDSRFTRRVMLTGAPLTVAGLAGAPPLATAASSGVSDAKANESLGDPATRARVRARILGSCGHETVRIFYRLNIYGFSGDGNLVPFYTMNHISVNEWTPLPGDQYQAHTYESGVYCKFDTDEALETWENPFTGERRKVWQFLGGPFTVTSGADGMIARGAELSPQPLRMEAFGGMVFAATGANMARSNPASPQAFPKLSSGPTSYWDTVATTGATVHQAFDEGVSCADAFCQFQNLGTWHPWMAMGQRPGRTYGRAVGAKVRSLDALPPAALKTLETYTPQIFDTASWKKPHFDIPDYLATQKG